MKTQNSSLLLLAILIVGFTSCKKEDSQYTTIKGVIIDQNTNEGMPNYNVKLEETYKGHNYTITGYTPHYTNVIVKTVKTDASGNFDFGLVDTKTSNDYFYDVFGSMILKGTSNNNISIVKPGISFVNIVLSTPPPYNTGDSLQIDLSSASFKGYKSIINQRNYSPAYMPFSFISGTIYVNVDKY